MIYFVAENELDPDCFYGSLKVLDRGRKEKKMFDLIKKAMFTGLGLAFMTKEKVEEISKEIVKKGKLSETEGKEFIDELQKKSEEAKEKVEAQIESVVKETLKKMDIATRDDFLRVEKQLEDLANSIKEKKPQA